VVLDEHIVKNLDAALVISSLLPNVYGLTMSGRGFRSIAEIMNYNPGICQFADTYFKKTFRQ
jgi:hypothetical protein